ncbi:MAG: C25 family cysteine peptidase [Methanobacteriota archaeon]
MKNNVYVLSITIILLLSTNGILTPTNTAKATPEQHQNEFIFHTTLPQISQEEITTTDGTLFLQYSFENCQFLSEPGKPRLPYTTTRIHIPTNAHNIQITTQINNQREEHLTHQIYPAEQTIKTINNQYGTSSIDTEFYINQDYYQKSQEYYPTQELTTSEQGTIRNYRYITIDIYPVHYRPSDNTLKITEDSTITISWTLNEITETTSLPKPFQDLINGLQIMNNPEPEQSTPKFRDGTVSYPTDVSDPSNQADYLIITANQFYDSSSLENLANHRATFNGFNVAVIQTSDIYAAIGDTIPFDPSLYDTEGDLDLRIKTFIKYVYDNWDNGAQNLQYIILIGDAYPETEPFYLPLHPSIFTMYGLSIPTDYWYSCINDDNEDYIIDDNDLIADLFIGRFSVQTEEDLTVAVDKTIHYELYPPEYPTQEWGTKILLTHARGIPPVSNPMREIRDTYILPNHREVSEVYADEYESYPAAEEALKAKIDEGHAVFAHKGHGGPYMWLLGNGTVFDTDDIADLNNTDKLPVILSLSCSTAMIDYPHRQTLAEVFVNSQNKGAVAFLGASRDSSVYYNRLFLHNLMNAMIEEDNHILGSSILQAKLGPNPIGNLQTMYILIGDPALNMSPTLMQSPKPELTCSINNYTIDNTFIVFNTTITNSGTTDAQRVVVELFLRHPSDEGTLLKIIRISHLAAETSIYMNIGLSPLTMKEDLHNQSIYLVVDRLDRIDELCEGNDISTPLLFCYVYNAEAHGPYYAMVNETLQFNGSVAGYYPPFTWKWEFGDGGTSHEQNPEHNYTSARNYTVILRVKDARGHNTSTQTWAIIITNGITAHTNGPYTGDVEDPIYIWGYGVDGFFPYTYHWDFGDGNSSDEQIVHHNYSQAGNYTINFTVTDYRGNNDSNLTYAIINERIPVTAHANGPYEGVVTCDVWFFGYAIDGFYPYTFHWDFGDGNTSSDQFGYHRYDLVGNYTINFTVTDHRGNNDSDITYAIIHEPTPLIAHTNGPYEGIATWDVCFHGSAEGGIYPYTFYWDFGDGNSSVEEYPQHIYSQAGNYTVNLTVTDYRGDNDSDSTYAIIHEPTPLIAYTNGPYYEIINEIVHFNGSASGGFPPYTYHWEFGDDETADIQNPEHPYSREGVFEVNLTVGDERGYFSINTTTAHIFTSIPFAWVDDDYNESTPDWGITHFNTIQDALHMIARNGTIFVYNGTYPEQVSIHRPLTLIGEARNTTIIDGSQNERDEYTLFIHANNVTITGFTIDSGSGTGICFQESTNITVFMNTITSTSEESYGIYSVLSNHISIQQNILYNLFMGITGIMVSDHNISDNLIDMNNRGILGIYFMDAHNSTIARNIIRNSDSNFGEGYGMIIDYSFNNTISENIVQNINCVAGYGSGIVLVELSAQNTIIRNNISSNQIGILLFLEAEYNMIYENDISYNNLGVSTEISLGKAAMPCKIQREGPDLGVSNNNTIYHNNFINNVENAYDTGYNYWNMSYPEGGNYWSNWECTGNPSNGSQPYIITGDNIDHYPFQDRDGWGNHAPYVPHTPSPPDFGRNINVYTNLSWIGGDPDNDQVTYTIYFKERSPQFTSADIISENQTDTRVNPGADMPGGHLAGTTKYYWKVVVWDSHGARTDGPVWCFKTGYAYEHY